MVPAIHVHQDTKVDACVHVDIIVTVNAATLSVCRCSVLENPTPGRVISDTVTLRGTGGQRTLHAVL